MIGQLRKDMEKYQMKQSELTKLRSHLDEHRRIIKSMDKRHFRIDEREDFEERKGNDYKKDGADTSVTQKRDSPNEKVPVKID